MNPVADKEEEWSHKSSVFQGTTGRMSYLQVSTSSSNRSSSKSKKNCYHSPSFVILLERRKAEMIIRITVDVFKESCEV